MYNFTIKIFLSILQMASLGAEASRKKFNEILKAEVLL